MPPNWVKDIEVALSELSSKNPEHKGAARLEAYYEVARTSFLKSSCDLEQLFLALKESISLLQLAYGHPMATPQFQDIQSIARANEVLFRSLLEDRTVTCIRLLTRFVQSVSPSSPTSDGQWNDLFRAAQSSWTSEYQGDCAVLFKKAMETRSSPGGYANTMETRLSPGGYANIGSIIQSSGTGKSRLVDEVAKTVFTFPFNVRNPEEVSAFPPSDPDIRTFFLSQTSYDSIRRRNLCFLQSLFAGTLEQLCQDVQSKALKDVELARWWRGWLAEGENRKEFYRRIISKATKNITDSADSDISNLKKDAAHSGRELIKRIDCQNPELPFFLYVDEAHELTNTTVDNTISQWDVFCSAVADITESACNFFCVALSTTGSFSRLAGPKSAQHSDRAIQRFNTLWAPYCTLPFDLGFYEQPVKISECTLEVISSFKFLKRFGRALWQASASAGCLSTIRLARSKLTFQTDISEEIHEHQNFFYNQETTNDSSSANLDPHSLQRDIAVLGSRIHIDFDYRRDRAKEIEEELVRSFLRLVYSVPQHREYLRSGYSSEPILAEAAAISMYELNISPIDTLCYLLQNGLISKGERGEMVARLLWILAFDRAIHNTLKDESLHLRYSKEQTVYSRPVKLLDVLIQLISPTFIDSILKSNPENVTGTKLEDAFQYAYVNYTHFGWLDKERDLHSAASTAAFLRGMAHQCSGNHPTIDLAIPVLIFKPEDIELYPGVEHVPLHKAIQSVVFISVKTREKPQRQNYTIEAEKLNFWHKETPPTPYIAILMELGLVAANPDGYSEDKPDDIVVKEHPQRTSPRNPNAVGTSLQDPLSTTPGQPINVKRTRTRSHNMNTDTTSLQDSPSTTPSQPVNAKHLHPRYAFTFRGCSDTIYRVISASEKYSYRYLLGAAALLAEHPRKDISGMLEGLFRQQPVWGQHSYWWVDSEMSTRPAVTPVATEPENILLGMRRSYLIEDDDDSMPPPKRQRKYPSTTG